MTEKRFHIINDVGNLQKYGILCKPVVVDDETDKKYILALDLLDLLNKLEEENRQLRKQVINDKEVEWLRNNTVWEQMPTSKRTVTKTTLSDKE